MVPLLLQEAVSRSDRIGVVDARRIDGDLLANRDRRLRQRIEHSLQIERRAADHLEHVGGGGLLLQRFAQLVEQARILDRDDGLGGEILDQFDLLVGEGTQTSWR